MIFFLCMHPQTFLCFVSGKKPLFCVCVCVYVCLCVCLLTFWLLARFLFLWMVVVSLWFSHATGQHAARARNRKKGKKKGGGLERRGEGRG